MKKPSIQDLTPFISSARRYHRTIRQSGPPRAVLHLREPRIWASFGAYVTNDVEAGYLDVTLTETTGNIWMLR